MDISNVFTPKVIFNIKLLGLEIPITDSIILMWVIMAVIIIASLILVRNFKTVPTGKQNVAEIIVETIQKLLESNLGKHAKEFTPFYGTLLIFLVVSNIFGLFNIFPTPEELYEITGNEFFEKIPNFAIVPPTKDYNVTLTLALITVFMIPFVAIKQKGVKKFGKSFLKPTPVMLPFNILDYGTRTLSLSLRLFGNILAGFIIIEMLYEGSIFVKPIIPLASFFFDLFDAGLQAYIFVFLSSIYLAEAIED